MRGRLLRADFQRIAIKAAAKLPRSIDKSLQPLGPETCEAAASFDESVFECIALISIVLKDAAFKRFLKQSFLFEMLSLFNLCSSQGSPEDEEAELLAFRLVHGLGHDNSQGKSFYPGVHGTVEPLRSISNSVVKRCCADDIWGVAP